MMPQTRWHRTGQGPAVLPVLRMTKRRNYLSHCYFQTLWQWSADSNKPSDRAVGEDTGRRRTRQSLSHNKCIWNRGSDLQNFWSHLTRALPYWSHAVFELQGGNVSHQATSPAILMNTDILRHRGRSRLTCYRVEKHQVLEVGDLPSLPALGHVGGLIELSRRGQRYPPARKRPWQSGLFSHGRLKIQCQLRGWFDGVRFKIIYVYTS